MTSMNNINVNENVTAPTSEEIGHSNQYDAPQSNATSPPQSGSQLVPSQIRDPRNNSYHVYPGQFQPSQIQHVPAPYGQVMYISGHQANRQIPQPYYAPNVVHSPNVTLVDNSVPSTDMMMHMSYPTSSQYPENYPSENSISSGPNASVTSSKPSHNLAITETSSLSSDNLQFDRNAPQRPPMIHQINQYYDPNMQHQQQVVFSSPFPQFQSGQHDPNMVDSGFHQVGNHPVAPHQSPFPATFVQGQPSHGSHEMMSSSSGDPFQQQVKSPFDIRSYPPPEIPSGSQNSWSAPYSISPRYKNHLWKTELCRRFVQTGKCPFSDRCTFAHYPDELRPRKVHRLYKTRKCVLFSDSNNCPFGERCKFVHGEETIVDMEPPHGSINVDTSSRFVVVFANEQEAMWHPAGRAMILNRRRKEAEKAAAVAAAKREMLTTANQIQQAIQLDNVEPHNPGDSTDPHTHDDLDISDHVHGLAHELASQDISTTPSQPSPHTNSYVSSNGFSIHTEPQNVTSVTEPSHHSFSDEQNITEEKDASLYSDSNAHEYLD